jgi:capsular polysaccharide biosynthesis protein
MRNLVDPLVDKVKNYPVKYKKIFLPRKNNTNMRYLNNNDEVEDYFRKEGFHFIECSDLSLEEKADIFSHAEIIVGLNGASFFNMLFCTGAKLLSIVNNRYATDMLGSTLLKNRLSAYLNITGKDDGTNRESNFTVSLDKIKRAYKQLLDGTVNKEYY